MRGHRIPVMMSQAEVAAIDEYRFSNRIGTRSGAVRRLCSTALRKPEASMAENESPIEFEPGESLDLDDFTIVTIIKEGGAGKDDLRVGILELETNRGLIPIAINQFDAASLIQELADFLVKDVEDVAPTIDG